MLEPLSIGGGIAAGVVWWAGLADGNPFTASDAVVSGAIPMPSFGLSLHADDRITPHLLTTRAGLTQQTSSVSRFDLDLGAGYRF